MSVRSVFEKNWFFQVFTKITLSEALKKVAEKKKTAPGRSKWDKRWWTARREDREPENEGNQNSEHVEQLNNLVRKGQNTGIGHC